MKGKAEGINLALNELLKARFGALPADLPAKPFSTSDLGSGLINCQKVCKRVLIVCQEVSYEYSLLSFPCPA